MHILCYGGMFFLIKNMVSENFSVKYSEKSIKNVHKIKQGILQITEALSSVCPDKAQVRAQLLFMPG